jgi:Protein of unknown function DUF2617
MSQHLPVSSLSFRLYTRAIHPEFFAALRTRRVRRAGFHIVATITPTGHTLEWTRGPITLTETITHAEANLPPQGLAITQNFNGAHRAKWLVNDEIHYEMSLSAEVLEPEVFTHVQEELIHDGAKRGLIFHYGQSLQVGHSPVSYLTIDPVPTGLAINAFHTFPAEWTVVKTQSLIEFPTLGAFAERGE